MKIHHCMADGISGNDLFAAILDHERETRGHLRAPGGRDRTVGPPPRRRRDVAPPPDPGRGAGALRRASAAPRWALSRLRDLVEGVVSYARRIPPTEPNSLVGNIGPHRRWTWANATLDDMKTIRQAFGGTVNDVIVAAVTGGLRGSS